MFIPLLTASRNRYISVLQILISFSVKVTTHLALLLGRCMANIRCMQ